MKVKEAITLFQYYQRSNHKKRTTASYLHLLKKFESLYGELPFNSMEADEIYHFLETLTQSLAKSSRRLRYAQLKAFYNFIITRCNLDIVCSFLQSSLPTIRAMINVSNGNQ